MLQRIKDTVFEHFDRHEKRGVFCSLFDKDGHILSSNGTIIADKPLWTTLDNLWWGLFQKHEAKTSLCAVDVVIKTNQHTDAKEIMQINMEVFGLFVATLDNSVSGVLLPHTEGIADAKHGIYVLKQKYPALDGKVNIRSFSTQRILVQ